jgi:ricin-type beta-trefoil lectin protein
MIRGKIFGMLSAAAVAIAVSTAGGGAAQAQGGTALALDGNPHPIVNPGNHLCLQPEGGSLDVASIVQMPCDGSAAQGWFPLSLGSNRYQFANQASHLCFDAFDGAFNGARLLQNQCAPISNDEWRSNRTLPDLAILMSRVGFRDTNFCIDVPNNDPTPGLAMQLWQCNTTDAQKWVVGFG